MVDEVILVMRPEEGTEVVEAVPLGNLVRQGAGVGMALVRVDLDVEVVGEDLLGVACCQEQMEDEKCGEESDAVSSKYRVTGCRLSLVPEGGGVGVARPPPSCIVS